MSDQSSIGASVVRFALGSPRHKRRHRLAFRNLCETLDPELLYRILERTHLAAAVMPWFPRNSTLRAMLQSLVVYQRLFAKVIAAEIRCLARGIEGSSIRAVLLKGPALWESIGPARRWTRRLHDIDVLVGDPAEMRAFVRALVAADYRCVGHYDESQVESWDHYELPPYSKRILVPVSQETLRSIDSLQERSSFDLRMATRPPAHVVLAVDVEPHKALFVYKDGAFPSLPDGSVTASTLFSPFFVMKTSMLLPYLAAKFVTDAERALLINDGTAKCLKLMLDITRLLLISSEDDARESIAAATAMEVGLEYARALAIAQSLTPEITMLGLAPKRGESLVDALAAMVTTQAAGERRVHESYVLPIGLGKGR